MNACRQPVYVAGAAALSAFGSSWRGLGRAIMGGTVGFAPSVQLAASHGPVLASEVPAPGPASEIDARSRKLMSHPAWLAARTMGKVLDDARWPHEGREEMALFLGVGASGACMEQLGAMLDASIEEHDFSLQRFGSDGLAACNPLFAFQLMNNFTLCHGAILNQVGGPNSAFFSRGTGTVAALAEAHWLLESGACARALAGGADSALHPVTWSQLARDGHAENGMVPGEGAALLALSHEPDGALALLSEVRFQSGAGSRGAPQLPWHENGEPPDLVVLAPSGAEQRAALQALVRAHWPLVVVLDISMGLGDALAAAPALAWCAALDLLQDGQFRHAAVLSAGVDGGFGRVMLRSAA